MNYATLEEAWGKTPPKISTEKRLHAAFDKHPLENMIVSNHQQIPQASTGACKDKAESEKEHKHEREQVRSFLRDVYAEEGESGIMTLLPKGFILATKGRERTEKSAPTIWDGEVCFEELAKWVLVVLLGILLIDVLRS